MTLPKTGQTFLRPTTGLILVAFSALLLIAAAAPKGAKPAGMIGKVKSAAEDGKSFSLRAKKGPYAVTWTKKTVWREHRLTTLAELAEGTTLHVLAQRQESTLSSGGGNYPPQLMKVRAVVAGQAFEPPTLTEKDHKQQLDWHVGKLKAGNGELHLDDAVIAGGRGREVLIETQLDGKALGEHAPKAKDQLFVAGHLDDSDRKNKKLVATEIIRIAPKYKEYSTTHALATRKPESLSEKKEEGFGF